MLCPACGSVMKDNERHCKTCGTLIMHGPKVRNEASFNTPSSNAMEDGAKKALEEEVAAKKAAEEAVARKAAEKAAAKKAEEQAALRRAAEEAARKAEAKRTAEEAAARRAAEEAARKAAAKKAEEEAAARRAAEEAARKAAAKKAAEEAAAKKAAEEAARKAAAKKAAEEAAARKAAEEAARKAAEEAARKEAARKAEEEAAARKAAEEAARREAVKKAAEEAAAAKKAAEENAAVQAAIESAIKSAQETAAKQQAAEEAAAAKAAEEAAKKAAEESSVKKTAGRNGPVSLPERLSYKIIGGNFPSAYITLDENQSIFTQSDVMVWMSHGITMETKKKRGSSPFTATYISREYGQEIGIAGRFPGEILVLSLSGSAVIMRKEAFLAAQPAVNLSSHVSMNLSDDNEASISYQRLSGTGMVFIAIGGSLIERALAPGETIKADTSNIAAFEESVSFQTQIISDFQNTVFGEGLLLSTLTGPGKVWLQTLPVHR